MPNLEYLRIITEIEALGIMPDRPPGIQTTRDALELVLPSSCWRPDQTVVVAGTNGKGSVCATLETLFLAAGETVGLYTSPHLESTTERIRINGVQLTEDQFCQVYREVQARISEVKLTHFEILTVMAAWTFFSGTLFPRVDRAIFEVGLGGKWDATNAIPHHHCIITQLGYDHQNLLGNTLTEIASNKFGIIQKGATVVHSPLPDEVAALAGQVQQETASTWLQSIPFTDRVEQQTREPQFFISTQWGEGQLALAGRRGAENTATALTYFNEAGYNPTLFLSKLKDVNWKGRMEKWTGTISPCPIYFSGDHNPQGVKSLLRLLPHYKRKHLYIIVGIGKEKDRDQIIAPLFDLSDTSIFLTETPFKGRPLRDYDHWMNLARGAHAEPLVALKEVFKLACSEDLILITGSLYLVGHLHKLLNDGSIAAMDRPNQLCH